MGTLLQKSLSNLTPNCKGISISGGLVPRDHPEPISFREIAPAPKRDIVSADSKEVTVYLFPTDSTPLRWYAGIAQSLQTSETSGVETGLLVKYLHPMDGNPRNRHFHEQSVYSVQTLTRLDRSKKLRTLLETKENPAKWNKVTLRSRNSGREVSISLCVKTEDTDRL